MSGKQILRNYNIDIDNGTCPYYATKRFKSVKSDNVNSLASCSINDRAFAESVNKNKVEETLKLFRDLYKQLLDEHKADRKGERLSAPRFDVEAADRLKKKGKWIYSAKRFGNIPGIAISDRFRFRTELAVVGLHCQYISGIDYVALNGKKLATSVVNSGRYKNRAKTVDVLIYSGHGGLAGRALIKPIKSLNVNGGEIPYSEKGVLLRQKAIVYECGPSCKCPPSCMNRVSQNGPRYKLEVYKTESREWGVRSRSYISSGSFVCEYVGKLQQVKKDNGKVDHNSSRLSSFLSPKSRDHNASCCDENETGFIIDASKLGNVGRFIGHSSSPSLVVQRILYDHDDERMPHIMFLLPRIYLLCRS
ncbi:hypothetical protein DH2020_044351 [Rehmannia glutinosa]|uniref:Histone-lysine N-methyltransferase n=1 Tax=Rehmannia glutinosa TaxID=99300 RepID=A0ABR0UHY5_REHGL